MQICLAGTSPPEIDDLPAGLVPPVDGAVRASNIDLSLCPGPHAVSFQRLKRQYRLCGLSRGVRCLPIKSCEGRAVTEGLFALSAFQRLAEAWFCVHVLGYDLLAVDAGPLALHLLS